MRVTLVILSLLALALITWWLMDGSERSTETAERDQAGSGAVSEPVQPEPRTTTTVESGSESTEGLANEEPNPYENEVVKAQLRQIADLYAENAKYPHFSRPILDPDGFREPEPFEDTEVDTPFPNEDGGEALRLQLATERYQYFPGDVITARLRVVNAKPESLIAATGLLADPSGQNLLNVAFQSQTHPYELFAAFDSSVLPSSSSAQELLLKASVNVDGQELFTTLGIRYQPAEAQLVGVAWARPEADFLNIALQYNVNRSGYYYTTAVLASAQDGRPLVQLQGEGRLQQGNSLLVLKAHVSALRAVDSAGPYILRSFNGYRGAETGELFDKPVSSLSPSYPVPGFEFDQYEDTQYVDPLAQERADFLRQLGDIEEESEE